MALINTGIPSLFNGVSQQPSQLRLPSQCEASTNFYPTIATGLAKRPPTVHKAKLSTDPTDNAHVAVINRDTAERYVLMIRNGSLEVFDAFTGEAKAVTLASGNGYLVSENPKGDFVTMTVADHTFVINKSKTVAFGTASAPEAPNVGYIVFSYNGAGYPRTMSISINDAVVATWSGDTTTISGPMSALKTSLDTALAGTFTVTQLGNNIFRFAPVDAEATWTLDATDSYGNTTMKVVKGSVQLFGELPVGLDDGYVCYVTTSPEQQGKGYYVRYDKANRSYVECPKPGLKTSLDPATMPHKLVRNSDGTFTFDVFQWEPRKVGDEVTNPDPTFVGRKINDAFFYRNRLGFLSDENVILSTAGSYFDFFAQTATAVVDSDPIDEAVANTKVSILRWAVPFNKALLLFSDQTQFQLTAGDLLTPKTVKADPVTEFSCSTTCRPVGAGQEMFFVTPRPGFSGLREYFVDQTSLFNDAADITAHVPAYIPAGASKLAVSTSEDLLLVLSDEEPDALYAYKYYWGKDEKVQSAWCRFKFSPGDSILGFEFVGSVAYLVIARSDGIYLEEMSFQPGATDMGLPYASRLDRKVSLTGTYSEATGLTSWTLPWPAGESVQGVLSGDYGVRAGTVLATSVADPYTVTIKGNYTAHPVIIGVPYEARYRFSEQHMKDANNTTIAAARIKMRRMVVSYVDTGYFRVEVTPPARDTNTYIFAGKVLGISKMLLGSPSLASGGYTFPVMSDSKGVIVELVNDTPLPSTFQSAEWEGEVVVQAKR